MTMEEPMENHEKIILDLCGGTGSWSRYYQLAGYDEKKGAICALPRSGTKTRTYPDTTACPHFKPRTWTRPPSCHDCDRKHGEMSDGSVLCSGWPFYKKEGDAPCQNGKMAYGKNLSLF